MELSQLLGEEEVRLLFQLEICEPFVQPRTNHTLLAPPTAHPSVISEHLPADV